jgi:transcriptional regulator with XRE-family HTH domain
MVNPTAPSTLNLMGISKVLGANVRLRRKAMGLSLEKLAEKAGITWHAIQQVETDKSWPQPKTIALLAKALGCSESDLFAAGPAVTPSITPEAALDVISEELNRLRVELAAARAGSRVPAPVIPPEVAAALARLPAQSPRWIAVRAALGLEPALAADSASPAPPKAKK